MRRGRAHLQDFRDLGARQAAPFAKEQRLALAFRDRRQGIFELVLDRLALLVVLSRRECVEVDIGDGAATPRGRAVVPAADVLRDR
jgi:hypothetical protein